MSRKSSVEKLRQIKPVHAPGHAQRAAQSRCPANRRPAAREGLCRRLRGRGFLARHLRPLHRTPIMRFEISVPNARRPAQGQEGADGHDPPQASDELIAVRRLGFRLPVRTTRTEQSREVNNARYMFHTYAYATENLPLLRPFAAQRLRASATKNDTRIFDFVRFMA